MGRRPVGAMTQAMPMVPPKHGRAGRKRQVPCLRAEVAAAEPAESNRNLDNVSARPTMPDSPVPVQTWEGASPSPGADVGGCEPSPGAGVGRGEQAQSRRRCGMGRAESRCRCGQGRAQSHAAAREGVARRTKPCRRCRFARWRPAWIGGCRTTQSSSTRSAGARRAPMPRCDANRNTPRPHGTARHATARDALPTTCSDRGRTCGAWDRRTSNPRRARVVHKKVDVACCVRGGKRGFAGQREVAQGGGGEGISFKNLFIKMQ